ncbi:hybrid sensor histidine kinase/response regulator [Oscillatoria sp. FACHB-1406]|uniref:hybrid sensor histidine kinase/response regulator n=1 Tax=Oscillatoria sp. FACHB-1406 TaxID=2692846 RepID=UPI00168258C0|nr:hybrid sensor histidine kinase/response regulator [Oscillatoria sp. FACHB-1406]MBD2576433.1 hybrid sensor histidine kinase/response regulator [Oscillatoria sp. FACHB-1406]
MNPDLHNSETHPLGDILIVDDELNNLRVLSAILQSYGYGVRQAIDGRTALKAIEVEPPDLILLDIIIPDIGGYEICQQLKQNPATAEIPIIFLSALNRTNDKVKGFEVGGADYITKPFQSQEAIARIEHQLKIRSLQRQLQKKNEKLELTLSQLKNMQLQLIHAEKMSSLGQLAAGVAYEVQQPMNSIHQNINRVVKEASQILEPLASYFATDLNTNPDGLAQLDRDKIQPSIEGFSKAVTTLKSDAARIEDIMASMCYFARTDSAQMQQLDVHKGLESTITILQNRLQTREELPPILLRKNYGNIPLIEGYPGQLNQVFLTLLSNAIDKLEEKLEAGVDFAPTIAVSTQAIESPFPGVEIRIGDNGNGSSGEVEDRLFNRYFASEAPLKGNAIGLSIAHSIVVERHGGQLQYSSNVGEGTEFFLRLPRQAAF